MHKVLGHAIHRILHRAIGRAAKSAAVSIYEDSFGENSHNRLPANPENSYNLARPKDIKRFFEYLKTGWDETTAEIEAQRQDEYRQEVSWHTNLTPSQQKAINTSYRDGSYKFNKKNRNNIPLSPAQKRNIIDPQPMPIRLQAIKFVRKVLLIAILILVLNLLFLLVHNVRI